LRSLERSRLRHLPLAWDRATVARAAQPATVTVPAGNFEVETRTVAIAGGPTWTIHVERAEPHRVISWETDDGQRAELLGSDRLKYWEMNGEGYQSALAKLGLTPRGARMP
jgi:hypothetical protein